MASPSATPPTEGVGGDGLSVLVATYNAGAQGPPDDDAAVRGWLLDEIGGRSPAVFALGLQEVVELNVVNVGLTERHSEEALLIWEDRVGSVLGDGFVCAAALSVVGTALLLFVAAELEAEVSSTLISSKAHLTSMAGLTLGNKAAVAVHCQVSGWVMCFVNVHLPAHRTKVGDRAEAIQAAFQDLVFHGDPGGPAPVGDSEDGEEVKDGAGPAERRSISLADLACDFLWFFGDLNSRMCPSVSTADVWAMVDDGDSPSRWEALMPMDQMVAARWDGRREEGTKPPVPGETFDVPSGFVEAGPLTFAPTYKLQVGTREYVRRAPSDPKYDDHCPAWCDRVFWRRHDERGSRAVAYGAPDVVGPSDHRLVRAVFSIETDAPQILGTLAVAAEVADVALDEEEHEKSIAAAAAARCATERTVRAKARVSPGARNRDSILRAGVCGVRSKIEPQAESSCALL